MPLSWGGVAWRRNRFLVPPRPCRGAILKAVGHSGQRVRGLRYGLGIDVIEEPVAYAGQVHRLGGLQLGHALGVNLATLPRASEELALSSRNHVTGGRPPAGSSCWPTTRWPWPGHSPGSEPYPAMAAVAERLVGRCAAPAQRHPRVLPDQRVVLTEDRDVAANKQRAVRAFLYSGFLRHRLLRPAVQAAEVWRSSSVRPPRMPWTCLVRSADARHGGRTGQRACLPARPGRQVLVIRRRPL